MRLRFALPFCLAITLSACAGPTPREPSGSFPPCRPNGLLSVGESLPDCSFPGVAGAPPVHLAELEGTPVVLNFWASWCGNCVREMPAFNRVASAFGDRLVMVGMNTLGVEGETEAGAEKFAGSTGVTYPLAYDRDGLLYAHFGTRNIMPLTVFVDASGSIRERHFGELTEDNLYDLIEKHLGLTV